MFSLVLTLATRTFRCTTSHSTAIQSNSPQAMRQHMDRDAPLWTPPVQALALFQPTAFYPRIAPTEPPLAVPLLDESLYNRPPPSL
jgi:hypothetical protein